MSVKVGYFSVKDRREEKQRSRDSDLARLASKQISARELREENGFFSPLDGRKPSFLFAGLQPH